MGDRCTGRCCRQFWLPWGPKELQRKRGRVVDGEQIAAMVIHLGFFGLKQLADGRSFQEHQYTCRNYDAASGNCRIYEQRPGLCRDYPYTNAGGRCNFSECTWDAVRNPALPVIQGGMA